MLWVERVGKVQSVKERKKTFHVSVKQRNRPLGREKSRAKSQGDLLGIAVDFA